MLGIGLGLTAIRHGGGSATPVCQACMGEWTGDLAAAFGADPFDVDGLCGHELSITSAGGFYVASTDPNSP